MDKGASLLWARHRRWLALALLIPALFIGARAQSAGHGGGVDLFTDEAPEEAETAASLADLAESSQPDGIRSDSDVSLGLHGRDGTLGADLDLALSDEGEPVLAAPATGAVVLPGNTDSFDPAVPTTPSPAATATSATTPITQTTTIVQLDRLPVERENNTAQPDATGVWCEVQVRQNDGVIRWEDGGRTAVIRRNDLWFHTPDESAVAVQIPEVVDMDDLYVLRVWGGGGSVDTTCTFVSAEQAETTPTTVVSTTAAPSTPTHAPTTTTTAPESLAFVDLPAPISVPGGRVQMGFTVDLWGAEREAYWDELESVPGNGRLIAHEFKSFTKSLNMSVYRWHMAEGRDLLLTWNGTNASDILDGSNDEWIRHHARELSSLPDTVMLRFWHEPDVSYKRSWIEGDPQNYVDAWMHVRRIFVEEGAVDNIEWVWCPTAWNWDSQGARYYPGDANVDWICADGYTGWDLDDPLDHPREAYRAFQEWADQRPSKPILIAEFGATARGSGERAEWVRDIPEWVNESSNIRAVVYFDYIDPNGDNLDWRIRVEADAWQAMKDVLSNAPFG